VVKKEKERKVKRLGGISEEETSANVVIDYDYSKRDSGMK
jgi:hypothetical protein